MRRIMLHIARLPIIRKRLAPSLTDIINAALDSQLHCTPLEIVCKLFSLSADDERLSQIVNEHRALSDELCTRYASKRTCYPLNFAVEEGSGLLLYAVMRLKKPLVTQETGVANGESTFFMLNAIKKNQRGRLYSTEVSNDVGTLLNENEKPDWALKKLDPSNLRGSFLRTLEKIGSIDLFLHDSDHSYLWQIFELQSMQSKMLSNSIIIADDVDASYAFIDFSRKVGTKPIFLLDKRKVLGVLVKLQD